MTWQYKKPGVIAASGIDAALSNYLGYADLAGDEKIKASAKADFSDVYFTDASGNVIPHALHQSKLVTTDIVWSWFSHPSAVYSEKYDCTYLGGFAGDANEVGPNDWSPSYIGRPRVVRFNHALGYVDDAFTFADTQTDDDHPVPAFHIRNDGEILAGYTRRHANKNIYFVKSVNGIFNGATETSITTTAVDEIDYLQFFKLSGRLYAFFRTFSDNPSWSYIWSDDDGDTWETDPVEFLNYTAVYHGYLILTVSENKVHCFFSTDNPESGTAGDCDVVYFYLQRNGDAFDIYNAAGVQHTPAAIPWIPENAADSGDIDKIIDSTAIKDPGGTSGNGTAWVIDCKVDDRGRIHGLLQEHVPDGANLNDAWYTHAMFDNGQWYVNRICHAGPALQYNPAATQGYRGLCCFDQSDPTCKTLFVVRGGAKSINRYMAEVWERAGDTDSIAWGRGERFAHMAQEYDLNLDETKIGSMVIGRPVSPLNIPADKTCRCILFEGFYESNISFGATGVMGWPFPTAGAHLRIPAISDSADTTIYVVYGNPNAPRMEAPAAVFQDYAFVNNGNRIGNDLLDLTTDSRRCLMTSAERFPIIPANADPDLDAIRRITDKQLAPVVYRQVGANAWIDFLDSYTSPTRTLSFAGQSEWAVEVMLYWESSGAVDATLLGSWGPLSPAGADIWLHWQDADGLPGLAVVVENETSVVADFPAHKYLPKNQWVHAVFSFNSTEATYYQDGEKNTGTIATGAAMDSTAENYPIRLFDWQQATNRFFVGMVAGLRVRFSEPTNKDAYYKALSANWSDPAAFIVWGDQEAA